MLIQLFNFLLWNFYTTDAYKNGDIMKALGEIPLSPDLKDEVTCESLLRF